MTLPNLAGVATADLVEKIGGGNFSASYINWSRTLNLLRTHAPGWLPEVVPNKDGGLLHAAPVGCYMLIRFRNGEQVTPAVPQAVMDNGNKAIPHDKITARDVTDTHRRGVCMAAAMTFGLAYELWAKMPLESGHHTDASPRLRDVSQSGPAQAYASLAPDWQQWIDALAVELENLTASSGPKAAREHLDDMIADNDLGDMEQAALWHKVSSGTRRQIDALTKGKAAA